MSLAFYFTSWRVARLCLLQCIILTLITPVFGYGEEVIVDNVDSGFSVSTTDEGEWLSGASATTKYGADYWFAHSTGNTSITTGTATWRPDLPYTGDYDVYAWWSHGGNRSPNAPYTINGDLESQTIRVNQQANGGQWNFLARVHFTHGTDGTVTLTNNAANDVVMADAVRFVYVSEIRAFWASRFEWPNSNMATAQAKLTEIMDNAEDNKFNTVLLQVRGQMDVHYNSPYEPWTNTYSWTNPGWDPLQYAIDEAHERGLELHAYVNTHTLASPVPPANTTPQHQYNLHGPAAPPGADNWTIHDTLGNPLNSTNPGLSNYFWLSPGVPEASWHTRRAMVHLASSYDVDGLHFDRIRTPGPGYSYDPISLARFNGDGNPDDLNWADFMRSQITRDLRNIYGEVTYHKPYIKLSSSPIGIYRRDSDTNYQGWGSSAYNNYYQDTWDWMNAHVQDFVVPQIYWELGSNHAFELLLGDWLNNRHDRFIVGGSRTAKTVSGDGLKPTGITGVGLLDEQQETRNQNASGHCVFSYGGLLNQIPPGESVTYFEAFKDYNYDLPTTSPEMVWKTRPSTGYITGYVLDEDGNPVLDARVNLEGDSYNYLSAYDGFFAILDVPPSASHTITAFKLGVGSIQQSGITVTAGNVTSQSLTLNPSRGVVDFNKPRYDFNSLATVRVYDADLAGAGTQQVTVTSDVEPTGEIVTLTETATPGRFEGSIQFHENTSSPGDNLLRTIWGGGVEVTWTDANDGVSGPHTRTDTAPIRMPEDIIIEATDSAGTKTPNAQYLESGGGWTNSPNAIVSGRSEVIKSLAPGLLGMRSRYTTNVGAYAEFTPTIVAPGNYNIYITLPGAPKGVDNVSPGATVAITHDGGTINDTVDLSYTTPGMADNWYLLAQDVKFAAGTSGKIRITNTNATAGQRFSTDAIKLVFLYGAPVTVSSFSAE